MKDILVSICCLSFNHEKYITECLEGFLKQETSFDYEILVHDDCSTDQTLEILESFQKEYPDIVRILSQKENQYKLGKRIGQVYQEFILPHTRGKYIAFCEGDDFWKDSHKLAKQIQILEEQEDIHLCLHKVRTTNEQGIPQEITYPTSLHEGKLEKRDFLSGLTIGNFFHTSSFMCRKEDLENLFKENPNFSQKTYVFDVPMLLYFGHIGGIYYIDEEMSYYRRNSIGSWTNDQAGNVEKILTTKRNIIQMYQSYDIYTNEMYTDIVEDWIDSERIRIAEYERDYIEMAKPKYKKFLQNRSFKYKRKIQIAACLQRIFGKNKL